MNIFVLDTDPVRAAEYMCDKHVVKMVTETAQMLSTVHRRIDGIQQSVDGKLVWTHPLGDVLYKLSHPHHPCTRWVSESFFNYEWLATHYVALAREYKRRYGRDHGAYTNRNIGQYLVVKPANIPYRQQTPFVIAMKQAPECIVPGDPVASYRKYYNIAKSRFAKWKLGNIPEWFKPPEYK